MAAEFVLGLNVVDLDPVVGLPADFTPRNGSVITPDGPGLGVEVDMEKVGEIALGRYSVE
jgi:L-alanine-DL-glutamate epimerase-like enolase superfamily enzyme